ncbi:hypothetical protein ANAPC2_01031 [Anaplasma phagocytophilum]|nr:hypothetical protein ANAPC2_01031 [Anaplasma phagocytophilum]
MFSSALHFVYRWSIASCTVSISHRSSAIHLLSASLLIPPAHRYLSARYLVRDCSSSIISKSRSISHISFARCLCISCFIAPFFSFTCRISIVLTGITVSTLHTFLIIWTLSASLPLAAIYSSSSSFIRAFFLA